MERAIDISKVVSDCLNAVRDRVNSLKRLNVVVIGKTGVGKSTLINQVFRERLAETGIGRPVTEHTRQYSKKGLPLTIYDTKGLELNGSDQTAVKNEIMELIRNGMRNNDVNEMIHCIWYCVNTTSDRIEQTEIEWLKMLSEDARLTSVPVIVVLTKSISKKHAEAMRSAILSENLDVCQVVPVLARDYELDDEHSIAAYGLDTLIDVMAEVLPDELQDTLQNVQIASLNAKRARAQAAVVAAATAAGGEGAAPVPFSDALMLIPTQVAMIASITAIYGIDVSRGILLGFVTTALGSSGATIIGKTLVSNLLKFIPVAGSAVGGAISAATAGALTLGLGEAYIALMDAVCRGEISESDLATDVGKEKFREVLRNKK